MLFEGRSFQNETVDMDFNHFENCTFENCTLVYRGYGVIGMSECSFSDVNWNFNDAAANTVKFMTALYHGGGEGGQRIIETTFENIRSGSG